MQKEENECRFVLVRIAPHLLEDDPWHADPQDAGNIKEKSIQFFINMLPVIIAEALTVPGTEGQLTAADIEVHVMKFKQIDIHHKDMEIIIWANEYPERRKNLNERQARILEQMKIFSPAVSGSVWVLLQPGSYGEFGN